MLAIFLPGIIVIMAILILILAIYVSKDVIQNQVGNHLLSTAQSRAHNIETLLNEYKETVQVLAVGIPFTNILDQNINYTKRMKECNLRIERTIECNHKISRIKILDNNGIVLSSSHEEIGFDQSKDEIFLKGKEGIHIGEIHFSGFSQNLVISVSAPIFLRGKLSGVLIIKFNIEKDLFIILADKTGLGKTGEIFLVNRDGYTLTPSKNYNKIIFETNINTKQVKLCFREHIENGLPSQMKEQATIYTNHESKEVLGTHYYIAEMNWCLFSEVNIKEAYKPVNKLVMLLVYIFLVLLFTSISIVAIITSNIVSPIMKLYAGTEEVIKGNLDYKVGTNKNDEIGLLSQAFDKMTKNLKMSKDKIEKYTGRLENKVEKRTVELNEKIKESEIQRIATVNIANDLEEVNISLQDEISERKKAEKSLRESEGKYRLLAENTLDCIWKMDKDLKFTYINQSILPLLGYTREEWTGGKLAEHCSKKEMHHFMDIVENELRKKDTYSAMFEMNLFHKDGREIPLEILGKILLDKSNKVAGFQGNARDITERIQADRTRQALYNIANAVNTTKDLQELFDEIQNQLSSVIDTTNCFVAFYDEKTGALTLPYEKDEEDNFDSFPTGKTMTAYNIQYGKPLLATKEFMNQLTEEGKIDDIGTMCKIWLGVPLKVEDKIIGLVVVQSYDDPNLYTEKDLEILSFVSDEIALAIEHKKAEDRIVNSLKEKEILLMEVHHRVKNNMQIISSLLKLQAGYVKDKEALELFRNSQNRVKSMSLIHEKIYRSKDLASVDFEDYVKSLSYNLFSNYGINTNKVHLELKVAKHSIDMNKAIPCGLIVNELLSNSLKHAFPKGKSGKVVVGLSINQKDEFELTVEDNGIGMQKEIDLDNLDSLGLQLIDALTSQLKGKIFFESNNGMKTKLVFPS
jgi:PAS domain S-box-containing protein